MCAHVFKYYIDVVRKPDTDGYLQQISRFLLKDLLNEYYLLKYYM